MAPISPIHHEFAHILARGAVAVLARRALEVRGAQGVTLGVVSNVMEEPFSKFETFADPRTHLS